jgi:hypothetical protein
VLFDRCSCSIISRRPIGVKRNNVYGVRRSRMSSTGQQGMSESISRHKRGMQSERAFHYSVDRKMLFQNSSA